MNKHLRIEEKPKVIECAEQYGIQRASIFYNVKSELVTKWLFQKDIILEKVRKRREYANAYAKKNYEKYGWKNNGKWNKESRIKWHKKHIFKHMIKNMERNLKGKGYKIPKITALDFFVIAKRQRCLCALSGEKLTAENISIDHIKPLSKGGSIEKENLQLVTKSVNYAKHIMSSKEFIQMCKKVAALN